MADIKVLDQILANQIAAGEVVERPASVIKELVENAIDAEATQVAIEINKGGAERMLVRDNGKGIGKDDLPLACLRHATSKIGSYEDLVHVASLGFRGEALASIASVAKLNLTSKARQADNAWQLVVENDNSDIKPASHPIGTSIDVQQLFYNTPARRRFLRADKTEFSHIETVVLRQALSRFDIAFRLSHNAKLIFDLPIADNMAQKEQRIAKVFGKAFTEAAIAIDFEAAGLRLRGWVADARYNRAQPDQQYAYINGRFIRDKMVMSAVKQAYADILFHGRHAAYVLYLDCDPASVDVNVHPTKHEVRFRDGRTEYRFIMQSIKQALAEQRIDIQPEIAEPVASEPALHAQERLDEETGEIVLAQPAAQSAATAEVVAQPRVSMAQIAPRPVVHARPAPSVQQAMFDVQRPVAAAEATDDDSATVSNKPSGVLGVALAQLHDIYILAQNELGLIVVDMHAAHERIMFERMKAQWAQQAMPAQQLLVPQTLSLSQSELQRFEQLRADLERLQFEFDVLGDRELVVRQIPAILQQADILQLLHDMLVDVGFELETHRADDAIHTIMANMACKAAVKAHHRMSLEEMNHLLRQMESIPHGGLCNHGRPAWKQWSLKDVDRWFLRGQ